MAFSNSKSGRIYLATQSSLTAAATLSGSNCCRHTKVSLTPSNPRSPRNDKTGTLSRTPGVGGYRKCDVSVSMDLAANGTTGAAPPDCDPLLQSLFGQASTVNTGVSVVYNLADISQGGLAYVPITIGHYREPSTVQQQIAWGVIITSCEWGFNDGVIATMKYAGSGVWVPDSKTFSTLDTGGKGGLSSIPAEPSSPVTNGNPAVSFQGSLTCDSNAVATVKKGTLAFSRPASPQYVFGSEYVSGWGLGLRDVNLKFDLYDDDSSMMQDLLQHGVEDTVFGASLTIGNVPGNIWTFALTGLQLTPPGLDDSSSDRWVATFGNMMATVPAIADYNELTLTIT